VIKKIIFYFLSITIASSMVFTNYSVFAVNNFYSQNDIQFYDSGASEVANNCMSPGDSVIEIVWNYFINKGLTKERTAGIMGNLYQESYISPTAWEHKEDDLSYIKNDEYTAHAWGIVQWDGERRYYINSEGSESGVIGKLINETDLDDYINSKWSGNDTWIDEISSGVFAVNDNHLKIDNDIPKEDLNKLLLFELDYAWNELSTETLEHSSTTWLESLNSEENTISKATINFHKNFEGSSDTESEVKKYRVGYAQAIYNKLQNTAASSNSTGCSSGNVFIDAVKKYVWPDFRGWYSNNGDASTGIFAVTPTVDYKAAILAADAAGKYTGDPCSSLGVGGGIDCGGFVSTIIRDSGWDPNYNASKGATGGQMIWLEANWTKLGIGGSFGTETLQPGDVAVNDGHTYVYIGDIEGFTKQIASASRCQRAPMAGKEGLSDSDYTWYRRK